MKNLKKEPWRILVGLVAIGYIVYLWIKKDIAGIYATMPPERVVPMIAMTIGVSLVKVAVIAAGALLVKRIAGKITDRNR